MRYKFDKEKFKECVEIFKKPSWFWEDAENLLEDIAFRVSGALMIFMAIIFFPIVLIIFILMSFKKH